MRVSRPVCKRVSLPDHLEAIGNGASHRGLRPGCPCRFRSRTDAREAGRNGEHCWLRARDGINESLEGRTGSNVSWCAQAHHPRLCSCGTEVVDGRPAPAMTRYARSLRQLEHLFRLKPLTSRGSAASAGGNTQSNIDGTTNVRLIAAATPPRPLPPAYRRWRGSAPGRRCHPGRSVRGSR
jgi:hypothetical protein